MTIMRKYNVLVFPAGTEIAMEIWNALKYSKHFTLFGATSVPCHAEFVFKKCFTVPYSDDPDLIDSLNEIINEWGIDFIYPAHDSALLFLTQAREHLNAEVVSPCLETVGTCRSKKKTYLHLHNRGADYLPETFFADEVKNFPVFIKPDVGQGSEGARRIDFPSQLDLALNEDRDYVICELLPGREATVDCFTDKDGILRYVGPRTRERIRNGIAVRSRTMELEDDIFHIAIHLNKSFLFKGAWFFQIKKDKNDKWKLLEVAPRIAGTMGLTRNLGINLPMLTLFTMMGENVSIPTPNSGLMVDRALISRYKYRIDYSRVYVDYDDTLVVNGKVNPLLMAFLYQAKGNGKRLYLLTRHIGDIFEELEKRDIPLSLFDSVTSVSSDGFKTDHIKSPAILIDDSFNERLYVKSVLGIPVFDTDMVESLIDWRV